MVFFLFFRLIIFGADLSDVFGVLFIVLCIIVRCVCVGLFDVFEEILVDVIW